MFSWCEWGIRLLTCAPRKSCIAAILSLTPAKLAFIEGYSSSEYISTLLDSFIPFSCRDCNPALKAVKSLSSVLKFLSARLILSVITFSSWSLKICNDIQVHSDNVALHCTITVTVSDVLKKVDSQATCRRQALIVCLTEMIVFFRDPEVSASQRQDLDIHLGDILPMISTQLIKVSKSERYES